MGHPVSGSQRPQPQPSPNEDRGNTKYEGKGPVRLEYAKNEGKGEVYNNGSGKEGFDRNQKNIDNLSTGTDGTRTVPGDKKDRVDDYGYVYTWDSNANGGKGAWGVAGKMPLEVAASWEEGKDISDEIKWYDDESYDRASGLSYEDDGSDGYDAKADEV